jgi:hypothetical protein
MKEIESIERFKNQSTWQLLGLGIITYGVYSAHYIQKQTNKINEIVDIDNRISTGFVNSIVVMSYISLIIFIAYLFVDEGHPIEEVSTIFDRILGIMLIVWGFKARNILNKSYEISKDDKEWFHGFWTFLFSPMYFNYKVNCICEESIESGDRDLTGND